jgi:hypothetical protein
MALKRRLGWIRLGVVMSIVWMIGVGMYVFLSYHSIRDKVEHTQQDTEWRETCLWECEKDFEPTATKVPSRMEFRLVVISCQLRYMNLVILLLVPIFACWIAAIMGAVAFRWVRDGFRRQRD